MKERLIKTDSNGRIIEVVKVVNVDATGHRLTGVIISLSLIASVILMLSEIKKLF